MKVHRELARKMNEYNEQRKFIESQLSEEAMQQAEIDLPINLQWLLVEVANGGTRIVGIVAEN